MQKLVSWQKDGIGAVTENMTYGECKLNASGMGKACSFGTADNGVSAKVVVQTPKLFAPFGAKEWESQDPSRPNKWDMVLSFKGETPQQKLFQALLEAIDEANVTHAFKNQEAFFGETGKSREIIQDRYTPLVNKSNLKYEPKLNTKLDMKNGVYTGQVFDSAGGVQSLAYLEKLSYVQALVEFGSLWVVDKRFGQTVRSIQIMVHRQETIRDLAIVPDENEDPVTNTANTSYLPYEQEPTSVMA